MFCSSIIRGELRLSAIITPTLQTSPVPLQSLRPLSAVIEEVAEFVRTANGNLLALTGAGVSTDSGIPDYRGENGVYTRNPSYKPIFFHEFMKHHSFRQRYWARGFLGYKPANMAIPNSTHYALASLGKHGFIQSIITQNVDQLHQRAEGLKSSTVLELHGTLHQVLCMSCGHTTHREEFNELLRSLNPAWDKYHQEMLLKGEEPRMRPDGDHELPQELDYATFSYPSCERCHTGILKPAVVFFGENIPEKIKQIAVERVKQCSSLLVIGSSLATYSALRLVKLAKQLGRPIGILNFGPTRGDDLAEYRWIGMSGEILPKVDKLLMEQKNLTSYKS
ncbi:uncharacterized protein VTP21DRAFT_4363 [Calcarisporiella thermophila]|uniref:uncharacterized protein n=1 Tax=Calcarisporiella thermophila TaxID=911321 RepID=UPI0037420299